MRNPVFKDNAGDPFVLKEGHDYYLSCTGGRKIEGFQGFQMYHSTDLQNWSDPVVILDFKDVSWAESKAWAPSMAKHGGMYYLAFCADQQIGIAVSDSPMGRYRDILGRPLIDKTKYDFQTIDPCLFEDDDGQMYLFFGEGKCLLYKLDLACDRCELVGDPIDISASFYSQMSHMYRIYDTFDISIYNEAPDIVKIGDRYLFSWAVYDVADYRYSMRYAWSDKVTGPFIMPIDYDHDNILLKGHNGITGCGHSCITEMDGEYYILYGRHRHPRVSFGREMCCDRLVFLDDEHVTAVPQA